MDLLAESITEVAVSGEIANTDRVLNIAYGIDRNFLFGAAVSMQSVVMHNPDLAVKFHLFTDYIDEDYLQRVNAFTSKNAKEGANKRGNSSRLTQSFHFFMFEPIFSPVNALNQPI